MEDETGLENELMTASSGDAEIPEAPEMDNSVWNWDGTEEQARELFDGQYVAEMFDNDFDLFMEYLNDYSAMRDEILEATDGIMSEDDIAKAVEEAGGLMQWMGQQAAQGLPVDAPQYLQDIMDMWATAQADINERYGLDTANFADDDGNLYHWTGTSWQRYYEAPSQGWSMFTALLTTAFGAGLGMAVGPALSGALQAAGLSPAMASSLSTSILNQLSTVATGGDFDLESFLTSTLGNYLTTGGIEEVLGQFEGAEGLLAQFEDMKDLVSTGVDPLDAILQAGGQDMLEQVLSTGEIDLGDAVKAGLLNGASSQLIQFISDTFSDQFGGDADAFEE